MRGGKRQGSGRPKGSLKGRKSIAKNISMKKEAWTDFDTIRGKQARGKFIEDVIKEYPLHGQE